MTDISNTSNISKSTFNIDDYPVLINARYIVKNTVVLTLDDNSKYEINPTQKMTVNKILNNGDTVVLRWIDFSNKNKKICELTLNSNSNELTLFKQFKQQ